MMPIFIAKLLCGNDCGELDFLVALVDEGVAVTLGAVVALTLEQGKAFAIVDDATGTLSEENHLATALVSVQTYAGTGLQTTLEDAILSIKVHTSVKTFLTTLEVGDILLLYFVEIDNHFLEFKTGLSP